MTPDRSADVVVVGAGQAGLSTAWFLRKYAVPYVVLDAGERPGGAWAHRWPSLRLAGTNHVHDLPGVPLRDPDPCRPAAEVVPEYFAAYERDLGLPVLRPVRVTAVREAGDGRLLVESSAGTRSARALVNATGTWTRPFWPAFPGRGAFRGRQLHTADYPGPGPFRGERVLVVGGGISAVQHLMDLATVGARTTWATRRPPLWRETPWDVDAGRTAVAQVEEAVRAGRPPESVVSVTGLPVTDDVRAARAAGVLDRLPMPARLVEDGAVWPDGTRRPYDAVLWATGFRAALEHLAPLGLREPGGGIRMEGTRVARDPRVHLVGYGPSASTIGANRAGRAVVRDLLDLLGRPAAA
ncbi:NAD(P)-binding domain-containing protein [Vallicoccus soli]|uniref:NAD(P)/FAD-dependent oxidoreductase n=1 Tax=Vallicoccus soli TaxID=2339232 RepID=A0A3A3ZHP5_9ACTN|nr:NAD(P)-binding domain-containing protein [Vallicoccus soli]RJK94806.1 NAD(P)/FAD-dependent oxidoreductase [Vallicoccus soli]